MDPTFQTIKFSFKSKTTKIVCGAFRTSNFFTWSHELCLFPLGISLAETYASHKLDKNIYNNKKVMILGANNTGYEVANHLAGNASIIHVVSGEQPVKMAWNTHFVGKSEMI